MSYDEYSSGTEASMIIDLINELNLNDNNNLTIYKPENICNAVINFDPTFDYQDKYKCKFFDFDKYGIDNYDPIGYYQLNTGFLVKVEFYTY